MRLILCYPPADCCGFACQSPKTLLATPETVVWGSYNGAAKPALTVKSGETVVIQTLSTCGAPKRLESLGIAAADIPQYTRDILEKFPAAEKGRVAIF